VAVGKVEIPGLNGDDHTRSYQLSAISYQLSVEASRLLPEPARTSDSG
jgi:hypothetical protein